MNTKLLDDKLNELDRLESDDTILSNITFAYFFLSLFYSLSANDKASKEWIQVFEQSTGFEFSYKIVKYMQYYYVANNMTYKQNQIKKYKKVLNTFDKLQKYNIKELTS